MSAQEITPPIHWGHFGVITATIILLAAVTWMKKPEIFSFGKTNPAVQYAVQDVPHYYPYVAPPATPLVAGASTNEGPSVINEDGSISPIDMGKVAGASTQDVQLSLDDVKVITIPDSQTAIQNYFVASKVIETNPIDNNDFETALSSNNQELIDAQTKKIATVSEQIFKLQTPQSLVKLQKLKIIQYNSAIAVLQNFTKADQEPELVGKYLQQFLKSQQDLDTESANVALKFNLDPIQMGGFAVDTDLTSTNQQQNSLQNNVQP